MNILGVELELDLFDADVIEVYEKENKRVVDRIQDNGRYEGKSTAESIRYQCGVVNDFFDSLFGAGTAEKIRLSSCHSSSNNIKIRKFVRILYSLLSTVTASGSSSTRRFIYRVFHLSFR